MQEDNQNQLNIELTEEIAEGTYANLAIIQHSTTDFVFDFIRVVPGIPKPQVKSRIIITPEHAKRLMKALQENLQKYEATYGPIQVIGGYDPMVSAQFGPPKGLA